MHRPLGVNPFVELGLQSRLGLREDAALGRLLPRQVRQRRQLALEIGGGNPVPETIFESKHVDLFLFDAQDSRVRQTDRNLLRPQIDGHVVLQIEPGLGREGGVEFHPLGAAGPGVEQFMFDFDLAGKDGELRGSSCSLEIDPIVNGDARLELRHFHQGVAHVTTHAFQFRPALTRGARGPCFQA